MSRRIQGRYQAKHNKANSVARKGKRAIVYVNNDLRLANTGTIGEKLAVDKFDNVAHVKILRDANGMEVARLREKLEQDGLADKVREGIGGNTLSERDPMLPGGNAPAGSPHGIHTEYFTGKSYLILRLKLDNNGNNRESRKHLRKSAKKYEYKYTSVHGPRAVENDETGMVEIYIRDENGPEAVLLKAAGWHCCAGEYPWYKQAKMGFNVFTLPATRATRLWAADFAETWAGEEFTLSGCTQEVIDYLRHGTPWSYPLKQGTRAPAGNGTTEHLKTTHVYRKPKTRNKLTDGIKGLPNGYAVSEERTPGAREVVTDPHVMQRVKHGNLPKIRPAGHDYGRVQVVERQQNGQEIITRKTRGNFGYSFGETGKKLPFGC